MTEVQGWSIIAMLFIINFNVMLCWSKKMKNVMIEGWQESPDFWNGYNRDERRHQNVDVIKR